MTSSSSHDASFPELFVLLFMLIANATIPVAGDCHSSPTGSRYSAVTPESGLGRKVIDVPDRYRKASLPTPLVCLPNAEADDSNGRSLIRFLMGEREPFYPLDGEGPQREIELAPFCVEEHEVTNVQFARFVSETGYITDSEKFGWSFVFEGFATAATLAEVENAVAGASWWVPIEFASWHKPEGPDTSLTTLPPGHPLCRESQARSHGARDIGCELDRLLHPVVHLSWNDASAYCTWIGRRLLTEAEFEFANRGGLKSARFAWGDGDLADHDGFQPTWAFPANLWQGEFPHSNSAADGWLATAPVKSFAPNAFGIYDMTGNVWEYVSDAWAMPGNPKAAISSETERVQKGGSFMCHRSYCFRYRPGARSKNPPDSASANTGFRCGSD